MLALESVPATLHEPSKREKSPLRKFNRKTTKVSVPADYMQKRGTRRRRSPLAAH